MAASRPARTLPSFICASCRSRLTTAQLSRRTIANTTPSQAEDGGVESLMSKAMGNQGARDRRNNANFSPSATPTTSSTSSAILDALDTPEQLWTEEAGRNYDASLKPLQPHRMHIYAHKHNTHITLVQAPRAAAETASLRNATGKTSATQQKKVVDTLMSFSTGDIGFKKAGRGSYDAAFQLAAYVLRQMQEKGVMKEIRELEVVLRGWGAGREAVTKALLGTEGRHLRQRISAVTDATRLKQGGPKSKSPRRLG